MLRLILAGLTLLPTVAWPAEIVSGFLLCEVKGQHLEMIDDGVPSSFSQIEGGFKVGDQLEIEYLIKSDGWFSIQSSFNGLNIFSVLLLDLKTEHVSVNENGGITIISDLVDIFIGADFISATTYSTVLQFDRYYKDDWQGLFLESGFLGKLGAHSATLDCRVRGDDLVKFSSAIERAVSTD